MSSGEGPNSHCSDAESGPALETNASKASSAQILDVLATDGVEVTLVELTDIQRPRLQSGPLARQHKAEREKRAEIIAADGEASQHRGRVPGPR
jgi:regulator of protease activity HflC (stomatin/prohibitin superfamily)